MSKRRDATSTAGAFQPVLPTERAEETRRGGPGPGCAVTYATYSALSLNIPCCLAFNQLHASEIFHLYFRPDSQY